MKLERIVLASQFDPTRLVTNHEIFSKKTQVVKADGSIVEQKKFSDDRPIFKKDLWRYGFQRRVFL